MKLLACSIIGKAACSCQPTCWLHALVSMPFDSLSLCIWSADCPCLLRGYDYLISSKYHRIMLPKAGNSPLQLGSKAALSAS
jgi:hypothetical protein